MRVLGLDLGARRIGVAVSDDAGRMALPLETLVRRDAKKDVAALTELATAQRAEAFVIGLPLRTDGREGPEAEASRRFAAKLEAKSGLPVHWVDERFTTAIAERALAESGRRGRKKKAVVDAVAATLLLRTWLEAREATGS